ncbi:TIR domain-containing protein [Phyllobacterium sp. 22552]|uniref:TIR domain-containing protein n=1 Tax=Phyllobacterium sp. 22552 TaxID=3453941 RepID=UPI003F859DB2
MARRTTSYTAPLPAKLSVEEMQKAIPRLRKRIDEVQAFEPNAITTANVDDITSELHAKVDEALIRTFGNESADYNRYRGASDFSWPINMYEDTPLHAIRESLVRSKTQSLTLLQAAVEALQERIEEEGVSIDPNKAPSRPTFDTRNRRIFLVHGHDEGVRESVARLLEKLGFEVVILHEQANKGRTVIEKFEANADVGFAVILLTPDDIGGAKNGEQTARARQNVVLELGYFIGRLGRDRVCALKSGDLEIPSDILGVVYTSFDANGGWRSDLAKELKAAGYEIDWNVIMG